MEQIHIRETNSEILIFLDYNYSTKLAALEEAAKILAREVLREKSYGRTDINRSILG